MKSHKRGSKAQKWKARQSMQQLLMFIVHLGGAAGLLVNATKTEWLTYLPQGTPAMYPPQLLHLGSPITKSETLMKLGPVVNRVRNKGVSKADPSTAWSAGKQLCGPYYNNVWQTTANKGHIDDLFWGCQNQEIGWPFLFKALIIGTSSYFGADSTTKKNWVTCDSE
jgi:hypothetical protein